ncbi:hypothetical protein [Thalassotalea sp. PLHSN55]|uniref:hypothetical protein n=1 Tax=Thalassotalea sp. PLHSN55 TaxID=3435888 RepID=UPI003F849BD6
MKFLIKIILLSFISTVSLANTFNAKEDLLLLQFDSKTDVDDLHTIAATHSILARLDHLKINYLAVAGAYGTQNGLYVPSPALFNSAFGKNWLDAHKHYQHAVSNVADKVTHQLNKGGSVWVMEAGQSDFTAAWILAISEHVTPELIKSRVHVIQHSQWNEKHTGKASLAFVKHATSYQKIPDGNATNNGSAGFNKVNRTALETLKKHNTWGRSWQLAIEIANKYNGLNGRYLNKVIADDGLDFSDTSELIWILAIDEVTDINSFTLWLNSDS